MRRDESHELEIDQDMVFQRRSWVVQRIGWMGLGIVLVAALLGLFGPGLLSGSSATAAGALSVEYERFIRYEDSATLTVWLLAPAAVEGLVQVSFNRQFLDRFHVEGILPSPERVEAVGDRVRYGIRAEAGQPLSIAFTLRAVSFGPVEGRVRIESGERAGREVHFRQFVYP